MDYGKKITELRESVHLSQDELALALGTNRKYIEKIENGRIKPALEVIELICKKFNISLSEFFGGQQVKEIVKEIEVIKEVERVKKIVNVNGLQEVLSIIERQFEMYSKAEKLNDYSDVYFMEYRMYDRGCCVAYFYMLNEIKKLLGEK